MPLIEQNPSPMFASVYMDTPRVLRREGITHTHNDARRHDETLRFSQQISCEQLVLE